MNITLSFLLMALTFETIGHLANERSMGMEEYVKQYVDKSSFPYTVSAMAFDYLSYFRAMMHLIYFFMLSWLSLGTIIAKVSMLYVIVTDYSTRIRTKRITTILFFCAVGLSWGLLLAYFDANGRVYFLDQLEATGITHMHAIVCFFEVIQVGWIYGPLKFYKDYEDMTSKGALWQKLLFATFTSFLAPLILAFVSAMILFNDYEATVMHSLSFNDGFED